MNIGIPKELLDGERRVSLTPDSCKRLVAAGHIVRVETEAGLLCGFADVDYEVNGAQICSQLEVWESEFILKVKEPIASEYQLFKENQVVCGFLHLAANKKCVDQMVKRKVSAIASENIIVDGEYKLLKPVSEIAGRKALFTALHLLEQQSGGKGMLLSGTSIAKPGHVLIIGGGVVGQNAANMALAIGAKVTMLDINPDTVSRLQQTYRGQNICCAVSTQELIMELCLEIDVLISTVLVPGGAAPKIITTDMVNLMSKGSVIVDVSSDQGGSVEPAQVRTSHQNPTLNLNGVIYYGVPNMPAAVPRTATESIQGIVDLIIEAEGDILNDSRIASGLQVSNGKIINQHLA